MSDDELAIVRRAYARQIAHAAGASDPRLEEALFTVRREDFLPPGPWQLMHFPRGYRRTPDADPVYLYQDVLVGLFPERRLNNGQPSFIASLIRAGGLKEGERAVHIGTGTGYYTAIMGHLAGPSGRVTGLEFDADLAARAKLNLKGHGNVSVAEADGFTAPLEPADVIYVNAGVARPAESWLDALKPGGRLVLPLTVGFLDNGRPMTKGTVFLIERDGARYAARAISGTSIYPCSGGRDEASEQALAAALEKGGAAEVTTLRRTDDVPEDICWLRGAGWSLTCE